MSIRGRVEDAQLLWRNGRREGAFLTALVAVTATSRRRLLDRRTITHGDAFERFLEAAHLVRLSVDYRGECHPIEHIFYKWFRCELVHEGGLPIDIEFMRTMLPSALASSHFVWPCGIRQPYKGLTPGFLTSSPTMWVI